MTDSPGGIKSAYSQKYRSNNWKRIVTIILESCQLYAYALFVADFNPYSAEFQKIY